MSDTRRLFRETFLTNFQDYAVAMAAVAVILMIIIPVPTVLLDVLMAILWIYHRCRHLLDHGRRLGGTEPSVSSLLP